MVEAKPRIFNLLDTMTVADCLEYAKRGYKVVIKRGHVQALILGGEEDRKNGR